MSDLERAVEAGSWAETMEHGRVGPRIAEAVLQAALAAGEIVLADELRIANERGDGWREMSRQDTIRAEAAEQALMLANQDAEYWRGVAASYEQLLEQRGRASESPLVRLLTWAYAMLGPEALTHPQAREIAELLGCALAAHDLRVAQQEGP